MLLGLMALMALAASMLACRDDAPASPASTPVSTPVWTVGPLLTVEWRGGLCQYGGCSTTLEVATDGAYRLAEGSGAVETSALPSMLVDALAASVVTADFDAVRVHGSTEVCPTAYDGQEIIYTFHAASGDERMTTCEDVIEFDLDPFPQALAVIAATGR